jgi:hypothetical protein
MIEFLDLLEKLMQLQKLGLFLVLMETKLFMYNLMLMEIQQAMPKLVIALHTIVEQLVFDEFEKLV